MRVASRALAISSSVLAASGVEHDVIGGRYLGQRLHHAAGDVPRRKCQAGDADRSACASESGREPIYQIVGRDDVRARAVFEGALGVPGGRHDQARLAVASQHDGGGPERLEASEHEYRIGRLDEMRAVVNCDQQIELLLGHVGTNGGEAFVEGHDRLRKLKSHPSRRRRRDRCRRTARRAAACLLIMPCW